MSMQYIRDFYGVPAKRGRNVKVKTPMMGLRSGKIVASKGAYLRIKILDLPKQPVFTYHPTELIQY